MISTLVSYTALDFSGDIYFMAALFYNNLLNNVDIYNIANHLTNTVDDDDLINILVNGKDDENNKKLFGNYLNNLNIDYLHPKETLIAIVFYYILHNKINMYSGIKFAHTNVSNSKDTVEYVGDDVGIAQILGYYFAIDDCDITDKKEIEDTEKLILEEIQQYVLYNLPDLPIYSTKSILKHYVPKTKPDNPYLIKQLILEQQHNSKDNNMKNVK